MSEIPLHTFGRYRKTRAAYTPLPEDDDQPGSTQSTRTMPLSVRIAAASTRQGKRVDHYEGVPEEEATLLGEHHEHIEVNEEDVDARIETASQVRSTQERPCAVS